MLSLTEKFERDIQQNHSTVYPLIIIDDTYYISTIEEVIISNDEPLKFKDYGLKISNIKESIDVQSHSFKISNVTLTLSNYEKDGLRLSDTLSDKINKYVNAYYKTQSCQTLEDCLLAYRGVIKRVTHDNSKITITLEDLTDVKTHKDVPIANLGYSNKVLSKDYINRPIPITYGEVDKAPVIPLMSKNEFGKSLINIIADDVDEISDVDRGIMIEKFDIVKEKPELFFESEVNQNSPLFIYKDDYFRVLKEYNNSVDIDSTMLGSFYITPNQYTISDSKQFITIEKEMKGGFPQNPPASNEFQTVKILRPNQSELLFSEGGNPEYGEDSSIINIQPDGGILRPEAAIDSEDNPTAFINQGEFSEFTTSAQVPNNQVTQDDAFENTLTVNLFTNYNEGNSRKGILYPQDDNSDSIDTTNYIWLINAWLQTNAHLLEENVKFICAPSGDMVVTAADLWLLNNGYRPSPNDLFNSVQNVQTWAETGFSNTQIFNCLIGGEKVGIYNQYALSEGFRSAWINACVGITGNEQTIVMSLLVEAGTHQYFPENISDTLNPSEILYIENLNTYGFAHFNNKEIFANPDKEAIYPTTVYKITCDTSLTYNNPNFYPDDGNSPISNVYVGQWNQTTMSGALQEDELWINLFYDPICDELNIPWLFNQNDFAAFTPTVLKDRHLDNNKDYVLGTKYEAEYNGIPINTQNGTPFNGAATNIKHEYFAGGYGNYTQWYNKIYMDGLCGYNNTSGGTSGGQSWWMIIENDIPSFAVLSNMDNEEYYGEFIDAGCNTEIKAGTLIPCGGKVDSQHTGRDFSYDYITSENPNYVNLTMGDNLVSEERLSLFFPIADISSTDAIETNTFVYGNLKINIPSEEGDNITHNVDLNDEILVQAYATTKLESSETNYNADFVGGNEYATNLINLNGTEFLQNLGEEISWDFNNYSEGSNVNNFNDYFTNFRIEDWTTPDAFDALSLVYRIRSNNPNTDHHIQLSTDIFSIGLLQYTTFKNVFDDEFYANVSGRLDIDGTYTNTESTLIENPADIMYHLVEAELGVRDITDIENLDKIRSDNTDINLAFSVKENVNSKQLLENIAKNTRLFPRFSTSGEFSFSSINKTYGSFDEEIKQEDIIKFQFTRTPSENIHTLVNVKYKKDYAEDEYTRETGYCDGYDFFGNSENKAEVYKKDINGNYQWDSNGYDYSYLGIEREDNILEFESDFIRTYESAVNLRNYLYLLNCNQHTIVKCTIPLKYIKLQVGDVIKFDKLNNGVKAFGEDYTSNNVFRNGQEIYPFFIITSVTKSSKDIKVECMQLHNLTPNFSAGLGSLTRRSEIGISAFENEDVYANGHLTLGDLDILENLVNGVDISKITTSQKLSADISNEGSIDQQDLNMLQIALDSFVLGDFNGDGFVNILDIITIVEYIIGHNTSSGEPLSYDAIFDINESGAIDIVDIINLVNQILEQT